MSTGPQDLPEDFIQLGHQLYAFANTHRGLRNRDLCAIAPRFHQKYPTPEDTTTLTGVSRRSQSSNPPAYPAEWLTNTDLLQTSLRRFIEVAKPAFASHNFQPRHRPGPSQSSLESREPSNLFDRISTDPEPRSDTSYEYLLPRNDPNMMSFTKDQQRVIAAIVQ